MADLTTRAKLSTLDPAGGAYPGQMATFTLADRDILTRKGPYGRVELDRVSWEALGRPVDVTLTIESGHDAYVPDVLREVAVERTLQEANGYDAEHDDQYGLEHLLHEARLRTAPVTRDGLVEAAALLVAAVELLDRAEAKGAES